MHQVSEKAVKAQIIPTGSEPDQKEKLGYKVCDFSRRKNCVGFNWCRQGGSSFQGGKLRKRSVAKRKRGKRDRGRKEELRVQSQLLPPLFGGEICASGLRAGKCFSSRLFWKDVCCRKVKTPRQTPVCLFFCPHLLLLLALLAPNWSCLSVFLHGRHQMILGSLDLWCSSQVDWFLSKKTTNLTFKC